MLLAIIAFIVILGIFIFVHESGHFISAKRLGVSVDEFGFGFPPRILGFQRNKETGKWIFIRGKKEPKEGTGTIYSLNWLPFGGFVKIKGSAGEGGDDIVDEETLKAKDSFFAQKVWKRAVILSAGVAFNFISAAIILAIGFMIGLPTALDDSIDPADVREPQIQIYQVAEGTPAQKAGMSIGDIILGMDGNDFTKNQELIDYEKDLAGQEIELTVLKKGEEQTLTLTLMADEETGNGIMGAVLIDIGRVSYPWYTSLWLGIKNTVYLTGQIIMALALLIKGLVVGQSQVAADIAGPIGIAVITKQFTQMGFVYLLQFAAFLSINLAILNFLPIPALDGGRVLFLIIEKFRRGKRVSYKTEGLIHMVGFVLLILLLVFVSVRDVFKFSDNILNFFKNLF